MAEELRKKLNSQDKNTAGAQIARDLAKMVFLQKKEAMMSNP